MSTSCLEFNLSEAANGRTFETCSRENNVDILRIKMPVHPHAKCPLSVRGISYLILPYIFFLNIRKHVKRRLDAVIVYSPPLPLALTGGLVKKTYGAKFVLNVQDIFPQNAIDLGILSNPMLIRLFEALERKAYAQANIVTVHSDSNRRFLLQNKRCGAEKLSTLHNWVDPDVFEKPVLSGTFRDHYDFGDRFIFFFGGVMGPSQGLDVVIDSARELKHIEDIVFLLIGDGLEKPRLEKRADDLQLDNVIFGPFVDKGDYRTLLEEVDVGLVCLSAKNKTPVVPGKILGYMSSSVPVLALLNKESDGHQIIRDARCGYSEISGDPTRASDLMLKIYRERKSLKRLGKNGLDYAVRHFSKNKCVDKMEELIR